MAVTEKPRSSVPAGRMRSSNEVTEAVT